MKLSCCVKFIISTIIILLWIPAIIVINIYGNKWDALLVPVTTANAAWFIYLLGAD